MMKKITSLMLLFALLLTFGSAGTLLAASASDVSEEWFNGFPSDFISHNHSNVRYMLNNNGNWIYVNGNGVASGSQINSLAISLCGGSYQFVEIRGTDATYYTTWELYQEGAFPASFGYNAP